MKQSLRGRRRSDHGTTGYRVAFQHEARVQTPFFPFPFLCLLCFLINKHQDWGEAPDVTAFYGRTSELATLEQWVVRERCRLISVIGMGGIGKTSLTVKLAEQIQDEFEYIVWRSLRNAPPIQELLADVIRFLSNQQETDLPETILLFRSDRY